MIFTEKQSKVIKTAICFFCILLLFVALVPLVVEGFYAHPAADDYTYGFYTHEKWLETHSFWQVLKAARGQALGSYNTWQGTFSSIFLMALGPAVFEDSISYAATPIMMLTAVVSSIFIFFYVIIRKYMKASAKDWLIVSSLTAFLLIETLNSPVNAIFWYNGGVHYVFMHSMMLIMTAMALYISGCEAKIISGQKKALPFIVSLICAILCGASNYSTALLGLIIIALITLIACIDLKKASINILTLVLYLLTFVTSLKAPGNNVRGSSFAGMNPLDAILESYRVVFVLARQWNWIQTIVILILLLPVLSHVVKKSIRKFRMPGLFSFVTISLVASMNTPLLYAMGGAGIPRQVNILKMCFQLVLVINLFYWLGWINRRNDQIIEKLSKTEMACGCCFLFLLGTLIHFKYDEQVLNDYSSYAAYISLRTGEAAAFDREYKERMDIIEKSGSVVEANEFTVKPYLLYFDDITRDSSDWRNKAYAAWWGKDSIVIK